MPGDSPAAADISGRAETCGTQRDAQDSARGTARFSTLQRAARWKHSTGSSEEHPPVKLAAELKCNRGTLLCSCRGHSTLLYLVMTLDSGLFSPARLPSSPWPLRPGTTASSSACRSVACRPAPSTTRRTTPASGSFMHSGTTTKVACPATAAQISS